MYFMIPHSRYWSFGKLYQVCNFQDFLGVKYEPYNVPTSKDIKIGAACVELVLTGMLPPCSKTLPQCDIFLNYTVKNSNTGETTFVLT